VGIVVALYRTLGVFYSRRIGVRMTQNVLRYTNVAKMLADLREYAFAHPGSKVSSDDNPMKLLLGFSIETPEGETRTWVIGLTDLKRSMGGVEPEVREALRITEGRKGMAERLEVESSGLQD
jgi:hypothetical protein